MRSSKKTILLIRIVAVTTIAISTTISIFLSRTANLHLPSVGTIKTLGVEAYWDPNLKNETTELSLPTVYTGTSNNVTLYLQSVINIQIILELQTTFYLKAIA